MEKAVLLLAEERMICLAPKNSLSDNRPGQSRWYQRAINHLMIVRSGFKAVLRRHQAVLIVSLRQAGDAPQRRTYLARSLSAVLPPGNQT